MVTKRTTIKKVNDETRKVACRWCNRKTNHRVLTLVQYFYEFNDADIQGYDNYETISCMGCEDISFRLASTRSDDINYIDNNKWEYNETEELFPQRLIGRQPLDDEHLLPFKIRQIYMEVRSALSSKLKILAGVGIGILIESVCLEENAKGNNLKEKIDDLVTHGVLTRKNANVLHEARFLRNRSAHELEAAKDMELSIAFDIVENLLQNIYLIPMKADGLKKLS